MGGYQIQLLFEVRREPQPWVKESIIVHDCWRGAETVHLTNYPLTSIACRHCHSEVLGSVLRLAGRDMMPDHLIQRGISLLSFPGGDMIATYTDQIMILILSSTPVR